MSNKKEIEVKYTVSNFKDLLHKLNEAEAKYLSSEFQRTIRFDTPNKDLEKSGRFLRIRSGRENTMTLKIKNKEILSSNFHIREELETTIGDLDTVRLIVHTLGYTMEFIMEKYRLTYELGNTIITLDEMPFGIFLEIEGTEDEIRRVSIRLNLNDKDKYIGTYWDLFEAYKQINGLSGDNIVFQEGYTSTFADVAPTITAS